MKKKQVNSINNWECTDPDTLQYCFKVVDEKEIYIYKQWNKQDIPEKITADMWLNVDNWVEMTIDFYKLTYMEVIDSIRGYYNDIEQVREQYGDSWQQIVCECYFETQIY